MSNKPLLEIEDLVVGYGGRPILSGLSFSIERGSFTGLLGANGSGKTTLIKTLLGIQRPVSGKVVRGSSLQELRIGYVPQRESLDPIYLFSAFEVVQMGLYGRVGAGRAVGRCGKEKVRECMAKTGSDSFASLRFSHLSGGQMQRVLIARALAADPGLLILDEPTAGIDAKAAQSIAGLLKELNTEGQVAILMVNHELHWVRQLATDVVWLRDGGAEHGLVETLLSRERIEQMLQLELG